MTSWADVEQAEPRFAEQVRRLFAERRHHTLATVRSDGAPRISGIEVTFDEGELRFGSMPGARKGADLARDPRFALHSATYDPVEGREAEWPGEAKISGRAVMLAGDAAEGESFTTDLDLVVHTHLDPQATLLVVEWWTPTGGLQRAERA